MGKLVSGVTLLQGLVPVLDCTRLVDIVGESRPDLEVIENWCLLGPLREGRLLTMSGYGVVSLIDATGEQKLIIRDQLLIFWDLDQLIEEQSSKSEACCDATCDEP